MCEPSDGAIQRRPDLLGRSEALRRAGWPRCRPNQAQLRECQGQHLLTKEDRVLQASQALYAQKFFNQVLPRLNEGAKSSIGSLLVSCFIHATDTLSWPEPAARNAHLVALTSLIKAVPKATYAHQLPSVRSFSGFSRDFSHRK